MGRRFDAGGSALRGLLFAGAFGLSVLANGAFSAPSDPRSEDFYAQSQAFVLKQMRELTETLLSLAPKALLSASGGREFRLTGLSRLDKRHPQGLPIATAARVRVRLLRLTYKDEPPRGLSRGDEIHYELQMLSGDQSCTMGYWFSWEAEGALRLGSSGAVCTPPRPAQATISVDSLFETLGSHKDLAEVLLQTEGMLRREHGPPE